MAVDQAANYLSVRQQAQALLDRANYEPCLKVLEGDYSPDATLIRARALLYLGRHHEVVRPLMKDALERTPAPLRSRALALLSTALFRSGLPSSETKKAIELARESAQNDDDRGFVAYYAALHSWASLDLDNTEALIAPALASSMRPRALELIGWIRAKQLRFDEQKQHMFAAWDADVSCDVALRATILHTLSIIAMERLDAEAAQFVVKHENLPWTQGLGSKRFAVDYCMAWYEAIAGRRSTTLLRFRNAVESAPKESYRSLALAGRAHYYWGLGEFEGMRENLELAKCAAYRVNWAETGDERVALLDIAELYSHIDAKTAEDLVQTYFDVHVTPGRVRAYGTRDASIRALQLYVVGLVYRAQGKPSRAARKLERALALYRELGYPWRVALVLCHLSELGKPAYLDEAREILESRFPNAHFRRLTQPKTTPHSTGFALGLTEAQRRVAEHLARGKMNKEIASVLQKSESTIKGHVTKIYRHYGVRSRAELIRKLIGG